MTSEALLARITTNSDVLVGKPTIRGLRISVEQVRFYRALRLINSYVPRRTSPCPSAQ